MDNLIEIILKHINGEEDFVVQELIETNVKLFNTKQ